MNFILNLLGYNLPLTVLACGTLVIGGGIALANFIAEKFFNKTLL